MITKLSAHFTYEEMIATQHRDIDNTPPEEIVEVLRSTADRMEEVRHLLGDKVITVSSGYRCPELNAAVGGAEHSAHLTGHAVDFNCYGYGDPLAVCKRLAWAAIVFDQLIQEGTWVHLSFVSPPRRDILTKHPGGGYLRGLPENI